MGLRESGTMHFCPACKSAVDRVDTVCLSCEGSRPATGWPVDPFIDRILGKKYRIERRLSVGGFGIVFLATQVHQGQDMGQVIIKMLHTEHAFDPVITKRFVNEVKAARSLANPHVVKVFDIDFDQGNVPYMVQEYVEGVGLADVLMKRGAVETDRAVSIVMQVAEGMDEAHAKGIVHRDLKPENIILQAGKRSDFVKIIDFGIARVASQGAAVTRSFVGTPRYMPPEQIKGRDLDGRADIFALGVIAFEIITGRAPIEVKETDIEYLTLNLSEAPVRLSDVMPGLPAALGDLVGRMMAKDPDDRPATMGEVLRELDGISVMAGWGREITGEQRVPSAISQPPETGPGAAGSAAARPASTPGGSSAEATVADTIGTTAPDARGAARRTQSSPPFTGERPISGPRVLPDRSSRLPAPIIAAGAVLVVGILAASLAVILGLWSGPRERAGDAGALPAGHAASRPSPSPDAGAAGDAVAAAPPAPAPDASADAVDDLAAADAVTDTPATPARKPKPPKKTAKPAEKGTPWTKL